MLTFSETFFSETNSNQGHILKAHESPWNMSTPLVILAFGSIFAGYLFWDAIIGPGTDFFGSAIFIYIAVNMSMVLGLLPIVGSPLPIMSYGGSSMLATMIGLSIVMSTKIHSKQIIH